MLDPLDYPYDPIDRPGLLTADGFVPGAPVAPGAAAVPGVGEALLAVGSNACAEVLVGKLTGLLGSLPAAPCTVADLAIGHGAHVSRPGFLAAAPFRRAGARTDAVVLWPTAEQLSALDTTEPSYDRVWLSAERYPLWVGTVRPTGCWVYATRFGLLTNPARQPLSLRSQVEVYQSLRGAAEIAEMFGDRAPAAIAQLLGTDAVQGLVDGALRRAGRVAVAWL